METLGSKKPTKFAIVLRHDLSVGNKIAVSTKEPVVMCVADPKLTLMQQGKEAMKAMKGYIGRYMAEHTELSNTIDVLIEDVNATVNIYKKGETKTAKLHDSAVFCVAPVKKDVKFLVTFTDEDTVKVVAQTEEFEDAMNLALQHAKEEQNYPLECNEDKNKGIGYITTRYSSVYNIINISKEMEMAEAALAAK